ncbi:hypothetical protein [Glycomyces xiaoerkulensis]|uniref:hypothetical protein n=1 Tax=Glycomyces xiaoerkulensis TaxID=2038139 RepID=UPI000C264728|nr:hypothetical protein [Glycomyces xiaoerkulensis]
MTVDHLSRHLQRDVGCQELEPPITEVENGRAVGSMNLLVGRIRMRSLWKEAGRERAGSTARRHRRDRL